MLRPVNFHRLFLFFVWLRRWTAFRTTITVFLGCLISPFASATILLLFLSLMAWLTSRCTFLRTRIHPYQYLLHSVLDPSSDDMGNSKCFRPLLCRDERRDAEVCFTGGFMDFVFAQTWRRDEALLCLCGEAENRLCHSPVCTAFLRT